jgi:hypothetical protein
MKRIIIITLIFLWTPHQATAFKLRKYEKKPKSFYNIGRLVSRFDRNKLVNNLRDFVYSTRPSRYPGSLGHKNSIPWLLTKLKSIGCNEEDVFLEKFSPDILFGINSYEDDFNKKIKPNFKKTSKEYKKWRAFTDSVKSSLKRLDGLSGTNLVWEKKGYSDSKEVLILGAHFDTIAYDQKTMKVLDKSIMPGADDNGTGVVTLLGIIEILNKFDLPKTIRVIFFDFQELGFLGSRAYIKKHREELLEKMVAYINVEMIGNDTKINDSEKRLKNYKTYIRKSNNTGHLADKKIAERLILAGRKSNSTMTFRLEPNGYANSDHSNFWKENIPAMAFSQNLETDYNKKRHHTSNDFPEAINTKSFYAAYKFLAAAVISWSFDITR